MPRAVAIGVEGEEVERKEKLKTKWAQLEAVVGAERRLRLVAQDIVEHFERRLEALDGKAMGVCMSRRICPPPKGTSWPRRTAESAFSRPSLTSPARSR